MARPTRRERSDAVHHLYQRGRRAGRPPLRPGGVRGTHYLVADAHGHGHMLTADQEAEYQAHLPLEMAQPEETVLFARVEALNTASVPRYAFFKAWIFRHLGCDELF